MSDRSSGGASRALRWWAGGWGLVLATVFVAVTLLTLVTWSLDRDGAETDPVSDMAFLPAGGWRPGPPV